MSYIPMEALSSNSLPFYLLSTNSLYPAFAATKKKYKPVAKKVRPVITDLPDHFRIVRNITGDPLASMPKLNPHPTQFSPSTRYSLERKAIVDNNHPGDFLWPEE